MDLKKVVEHFGSKAALARALGLHRAAITEWGDDIPIPRQYQIQVVTGGKFQAVPPA